MDSTFQSKVFRLCEKVSRQKPNKYNTKGLTRRHDIKGRPFGEDHQAFGLIVFVKRQRRPKAQQNVCVFRLTVSEKNFRSRGIGVLRGGGWKVRGERADERRETGS